jgi:hypothetical protein
MNLYWLCFVLLQCNFAIPSYFPFLSDQERVKQVTERQFGGSEKYEEYQRALVLRFFKERIAFGNVVEKLKEPKTNGTTVNLEHIRRLAQPKVVVLEPIILPSVLPKRLTEQEKSTLFARLAEPKNRTDRYEDSIVCQKKSPRKKNKK